MGCIAVLLTTIKLNGCVLSSTCQESRTRLGVRISPLLTPKKRRIGQHGCIAVLLSANILSSCVSHSTCKESTTRHELWLVGNKKGVKHTIVAKRISCLVSPNGSVGRAVCFYSSDYEASTLIGGKHEGCNHKKRTWLYCFFGSIGATWGN